MQGIMTMRACWLSCGAFLLLAPTCAGKQNPTPHPRTTSAARAKVTGRVFAITAGGDLKPARIADVYIFFMSGSGDTAGHIYYRESGRAIEAFSKDLDASGGTWTQKMICLKQLYMFQPVLLKVLDWAEANKKMSQITILKTDEDGNFTTTLAPGAYTIAIRGRAGFDEALWESGPLNDISVSPNHNLDLKFSSPSQSCPSEPNPGQ